MLFSGSALAGIPGFRPTVEMVSTAWYAGWHATDFPLSKVSWEKYTQMTYAFAYVGPPTEYTVELIFEQCYGG